jgi:hypothetical protein
VHAQRLHEQDARRDDGASACLTDNVRVVWGVLEGGKLAAPSTSSDPCFAGRTSKRRAAEGRSISADRME